MGAQITNVGTNTRKDDVQHVWRKLILTCCLILVSLFAEPALAEDRPQRVVSLNVCTDQMAMLVAEEGQIYSLSHLATDASVSMMVEEARRYPANSGRAEEVFMMKPDLVIAGSYTTRTTVELLRKLGIRVEEFTPATSLDDVRVELRRMGQLLGQEERAATVIAEFDAKLAELTLQPATGKSVALYYANSYTSGGGTLVDAVVEVAGLRNISRNIGLTGLATLQLEDLITASPDIVVLGDHQYSTPALAQANFSHPAFVSFIRGRTVVAVPPPETICGGPWNLEAAHALREAALGQEQGDT